MPKQTTINAAKRDKAQGKSASTQAGEFVKEEMDKIRSGKTSGKTRKNAQSAMKKEGHSGASPAALSKHAHTAAQQHTPAERSASAKQAARTKSAKNGPQA